MSIKKESLLNRTIENQQKYGTRVNTKRLFFKYIF